MNPAGSEITVVRGRVGEELGEELVRFWAAHGALDEATARLRLADVVCVLRDGGGEIAGVNSVYADSIRLIGNRSFWIYRDFISADVAAARPQMIEATFAALEREFDTSGEGPVGLALLVEDQAMIMQRPEAVWPEAGLMYAGYTEDRRQVRISYFERGTI